MSVGVLYGKYRFAKATFAPYIKFEKMRHFDASAYIKAVPLQAWTGPEGSRRLRLPDFKTIST